MTQPERFASEETAAGLIEVPVTAVSRRQPVPVLVVIRADGAAGAPAAEDATLAA